MVIMKKKIDYKFSKEILVLNENHQILQNGLGAVNHRSILYCNIIYLDCIGIITKIDFIYY